MYSRRTLFPNSASITSFHPFAHSLSRLEYGIVTQWFCSKLALNYNNNTTGYAGGDETLASMHILWTTPAFMSSCTKFESQIIIYMQNDKIIHNNDCDKADLRRYDLRQLEQSLSYCTRMSRFSRHKFKIIIGDVEKKAADWIALMSFPCK